MSFEFGFWSLKRKDERCTTNGEQFQWNESETTWTAAGLGLLL
jgi:hypothetical protein